MVVYYTALIVLGTNTMPATKLIKMLGCLKALGAMIKYSDIICTKFLRPIDEGDFLNEAVLISTTLSKILLENKLRCIADFMNIDSSHDIDLDLVTYDGAIVNKGKVIKYPFLFDFIKQLQPELLTWRQNT
ncbi:2-amino-4-hydroxy-6-hydroxymethyldihydropteridine diphosphokinase [Sphingobacterium siyangense]|uniref:2-amino-4-hydroxy-6- hydroxymethyldihydropteridine diphosphokinase n=1 Tax=Sphingobacterium siyangense TaxID=459529 RepID=UPI003C7618DB